MKNNKIASMVGVAFLMAIVIVLQLLGSFIKLGPVSISLVLIPIVVGAAVYGPMAGALLGGAFSLVVLFQPDTAFFYGISVFGTVLTVLAKGVMSGFLAGLVYRLIAKKSRMLAVFVAAIVCPLVNTGIFLLGCRLFFWNGLGKLGVGNVFVYVITVMVGFNFLAEFATNVVCAPLIIRIMDAIKKK